MSNNDGKVVCTGTTSHAFLNKKGKPIRIKQEFPDFFRSLICIKNENFVSS